MAGKWQGEPKQWRVRAKSTDGLTVTLGNHDTERQAQADAEKFVKGSFYRDVTVERITPAADPGQRT
jgi:hypothetical protein